MASAQTDAIARAIIAASPPPGAQLVDVSREYTDALLKIGRHIQEDELEAAVQALHLLITAETPVFHPHWSDIRRHVSSVEATTRLLGTFPAESIRSYGRLHGPAARRLCEKAKAQMDEESLRRVGLRHFHTSYGARALDLYGQLAFDRGSYLEAGHAWDKLHRHATSSALSRPTLAAKAAIAYHFGGEATRSRAMSSELQRQYPGARSVVAGEEAVLVDVVRRAFETGRRRSAAPEEMSAWLSAAGSTDSTAVMSPCTVSPLAVWKQRDAYRAANVDALLHRTGDEGTGYGPVKLQSAMSAGRVRLTMRSPGEPGYGFDLPAIAHPVVLQEAIVCRREQGVVAVDPANGREIWRLKNFPVHEMSAVGKTRNHYLPLSGDMGRHTLTYADGRVYAVGNFRRVDPETYRKFASSLAEDSCAMAAISVENGRIAWQIGRGKGDSEATQKAKYLTAPTYFRGRLFSLAKVGNRYRVFCLDARTGNRLWDSVLGPIPTHSGEQLSWQAAYTMELMTERASPVAVEGGRVFLTTNSGLVAALEGDRGAPVWAFRYDSGVSGRAAAEEVREVANLAFLVSAARKPFFPQNPLIVVRGRVICLPCDSRSVLALHSLTGELLWEVARNGARHLVAVDGDRVLLCDPGLTVLSVDDGSVLKRTDVEVADRPAVTARKVIASGAGRIVQMDLSDYAVDVQPVEDAGAVLGTLVAVAGKLVAANAAGLSVFLGFDDAWKLLGDQVEAAADPARGAALRMQRGILAFQADRLDRAAAEFGRVAAEARGSGSAEMAGRVRPWLYRTFLGRAAAASKDSEVGELLNLAAAQAATDRERIRVAAERIRYHERFGRAGKAAEIAQKLTETHAAAPVVLPPSLRVSGHGMTGYTYGHAEIRRLVGAHGRAVYAAFDQKLAAALESGQKTGNVEGMLNALRRWPSAARAGATLLAAAEIVYLRAGSGPGRDEAAARASRLLGEIENYPDPELLTAARAALVLVDARFRPRFAGWQCAGLRGTPTNAPVRFAGFEGTVDDVIRMGVEAAEAGTREAADFAGVRAPISSLFRSPQSRMALLRGRAGRPVTVGDIFFVHDEGTVICLDSRRSTYEQSCLWEVGIEADKLLNLRFGYVEGRLERLAVATARELVVVDTHDGREQLRKPLPALGIGAWTTALGHGPRVIFADRAGVLTCVNVVTGEREWRDHFGSLSMASLSTGCDLLHCAQSEQVYSRIMDIRTGRDVCRLTYHNRRDGMRTAMNTDGFVASIDEQRSLQFHDPRRSDSVLSRIQLEESPLYDVLAFGYRSAVLRGRETHGRLRLYDVAGEHEPATVAVKNAAGNACEVSRVMLAGDTAYIVCCDAGGHGGLLSAPVLVSVKLPEAKEAWRFTFAGKDEGRRALSAPQVFGRLVSVFVRPENDALPCRHVLIESRDGSAVLDYSPSDSDAGGDRPGEWAGAPLVMNGKAYLDSHNGILCLQGAM